MKRIVALLALLLSISGFLYMRPVSAAEGVTLEFWELSVGEELMRSLLDRFERQNPGVHVRFQQLSWDFGLDKIITSIAAGNPPDVIELGTDWVPQFSSSGVLSDLTPELAPLKEKFLLWDTVTYKEKLYGMPWLAGTRILFYNRELFAKAGLNPDKPPATWKELAAAAKAVDELGPNIYGIGLHVGEPYSPWQEFLPFAWGNGGEVLDPSWNRCLLDQPPVVEALEFYRSLKPYALVQRQEQVNQLFAEGRIGIQLSGTWNFAGIPRLNPTLNYGVGLIPRPDHSKGTHAAFAGGEVLVIPKSTRHREQALKLVSFLAEEEQAMAIVEAQRNVIPTVASAINHPYYQNRPEQKVVFEQVRTAVAPPGHPGWGPMQEKITRAIEEVLLKDKDPELALKETAAEINRIIQTPEVKGRFSDTLVFAGFLGVLAVLAAGGMILRRRRAGPRVRRPFGLADALTGYLFIAPWLIVFMAFSLIPLLHSFVLSFSRYNLLSAEISFVGLRNFWEVLREPDFLQALWNTLIFALGTIPPTMALALFAAVLINTRIPFKRLYQAGLFLPVATSVIVICMIFSYLYAQDGLVNRVLEWFHLPVPDPSWLLNTKWALPAIMGMNIWSSFGYYMVLFLAGLQTIPSELYEAASIDGANDWQKFRYITIPQLMPILLLATVINTIRALQVFPEIFALTQGGPLGATSTVVWHLYKTGFQRFDMGHASAIGYILFMVTMMLSWVQIKAFRVEDKL